MTDIKTNLDNIEENILNELKDFQRATVERIDDLYRNGQKRILVSDEVGLGKTMVAKGVIAKFANLRKQEDDNLVKVVYICSNSTIVDQNLNKLRLVSQIKPESSFTSRLSMQHLNIFKQENDPEVLNKYIQLIPLTPDTSFNVSNSQGTVHERALMLAILKLHPTFEDYNEELEEIFRFGVSNWEDIKNDWDIQVWECNKQSNGNYQEYILNEVDKYRKDLDKLVNLCKKIKQKGFSKKLVKPHIVKFRKIFADISLNKLNPDLIIMDEFQRFRHLLNSDEESEMNQLTKKFFNSEDVRILMLSATPYKMYSTLDEISEEDVDAHYSEFIEVVNFLKKSEKAQEKFIEVWNDYSVKLLELDDDTDSFIQAKSNAEDELYSNICRTERITEDDLADIIDSDDAKNSLKVLEEDINSYMEIQKFLDDLKLDINVPVDYIKSSPYLMSFMKNYQLKRKIEKYFEKHPENIDKIQNEAFWLNENEIMHYNKIPFNNARLTNLMNHLFNNGASKLLWIPPSKPYYELSGAFNDCENFTKTLIFSSWEMVPRMISSLVSYEMERQTIGNLNRDIKYFASRRSPSPRLRFSLRSNNSNEYNDYYDRAPAQMQLFALLYPSIYLANVYNPINCLNRNLTLSEIEEEVKSKIKQELNQLPSDDSLGEDSRWYYLAPMLLDSKDDVELWLGQIDELIELNNYSGKSFIRHLELLKKQYRNNIELGNKPSDLEDVLCDIALASPAICTYRAYEKELPQNSSMDKYKISSTLIARKFIDLMNLPESIAILDLIYHSNSKSTYWKNVLKYSKEGNLQAVFDEYVHILSNPLNKNDVNRIDIINHNFLSSFDFRTTSYDIDTFNSFKSRIEDGEKSSKYLRTHYAASFTKGRSEESDSNRRKTLMNAFNSPFRPFVLASTSIGQEGLDFHNYCRKIVHWNLPSNPIDLEQREGRINRFECLAIRQNVSKRYGDNEFKENIWEELFEIASKTEKTGQCSDLIPHWGLTDSEDMVKIERIVPMYPFSNDETNYDRLIKILSLYRLTLGQPRQEELLETIFDNGEIDEKELKKLFINLSPYYKNNI